MCQQWRNEYCISWINHSADLWIEARNSSSTWLNKMNGRLFLVKVSYCNCKQSITMNIVSNLKHYWFVHVSFIRTIWSVLDQFCFATICLTLGPSAICVSENISSPKFQAHSELCKTNQRMMEIAMGFQRAKQKVCVCNRNHGFNLSACYALQYRRTVNSLAVKCWCLLRMKCRIEHEIKGNPLRVGLKKGSFFTKFFFLFSSALAKSFRNMNALHPAWHTFKEKRFSLQ